MGNVRITVEDQPKAEERRAVFDGLVRYNADRVKDAGGPGLTVFLRDEEGAVVGGLLGEMYWGWLHVQYVWMDERLRGQGHGEKLLAIAEREAASRGCGAVFLDTFSFQAPGFYERCGYEVFGKLEDFPPGHQRYFMRKSLAGGTSDLTGEAPEPDAIR